ncbi:MAG TPA: hypothetical protein VK826_10595 [Bacteroidia bacterium]|nr:hypothetical protein [Bacteroidia bacterium]
MILAIIAISSLIQGGLYFFAAKRKLVYLDFIVLGCSSLRTSGCFHNSFFLQPILLAVAARSSLS